MARKKSAVAPEAVDGELPPTVPELFKSEGAASASSVAEPTPAEPSVTQPEAPQAMTKEPARFRIRFFKDFIVDGDERAVREAAVGFRAQMAPDFALLVEPTTEPATGRWMVRDGQIVLEPQVFEAVVALKAYATFVGDAARLKGEEDVYSYQPQFSAETITQVAKQLGIPLDKKTAILSDVQGAWVNALFMQEMQHRIQLAQAQASKGK